MTGETWQARHARAWQYPRGEEVPLVALIRAWQLKSTRLATSRPLETMACSGRAGKPSDKASERC